MDFGSEYILLEEEEEEEVHAKAYAEPHTSSVTQGNEANYVEDYSGFECEIMEFDEDENEPEVPTKPKKVNTNTVKVEMKKLEEEPDVMVEKSKHAACQDCEAVYSHLATSDAGKKVWVCNFCNKENDIKTELPDLSGKNDVMYVENISKLPELKPTESSKLKIIFLIDTSASMSQTKQMAQADASEILKGIVKKANEIQQQQLLALSQQDGVQLAILQQTTHIEVSRLQFIKASVINVINKLRVEQPEVRVGLITFHENVNVYGDGKSEMVVVQGDQLEKLDDLRTIGLKFSELCPLRESADALIKKIELLEENGRTALGPAVVIAQYIASSVNGSKIVLCTDGIANIGLGRLEETTEKEIDNFYNDVIARSISSGISISIICVDNAGLNTKLGQVPTETGGILEKVQASEVEGKISEELKRATVAVKANIKFVVHKSLYAMSSTKPDSKSSNYLQLIGNVQLDKQLAFGFAFKPEEQTPVQSQDAENSETKTGNDLLPFQIQVNYFNLSEPSVRVERVWTTEKKVTKSRTKAEETMNLKTVVENFVQQSSKALLEAVEHKKSVKNEATKLSNDAHVYVQRKKELDQVTQLKLDSFAELMFKIVRTGDVTDDYIAELNKFKDARAGQVQG